MTDRERLIELFEEMDKNPEITCPKPNDVEACKICKYAISEWLCDMRARKADHLLANGVIVPPCNVGDIVYILEDKCKHSGEKNEPRNSCKQYWDNVYKNGMWGCAGKDKKGNKIYCKQKEMVRYIKESEYSLLLYSDPTKVLGENLFLTKEEAEQALKEREQNDRK